MVVMLPGDPRAEVAPRPPRRRFLFAGAVGVALGVVAAGCERSDSSLRVECMDSVVWRGVTYLSDQQVRVTPGPSVGSGRIPCRGGDPSQANSSPDIVRVHRFGAVPPAVAIAVEGKKYAYYAQGFPLPLRSHPLHRRVYGSDKRPKAPSRACGDGWEWDAVVSSVVAPNADGIVVRRQDDRSEQFLKLHAEMRVVGLSRYGLPYLRRGDRVRASGVTCPGRNLVLNEIRRRG